MDRRIVNHDLRANSLWATHAAPALVQWSKATRLPFPLLAAHIVYSGVEINEYGQTVVVKREKGEEEEKEEEAVINDFLYQYGAFNLVSAFGVPSLSVFGESGKNREEQHKSGIETVVVVGGDKTPPVSVPSSVAKRPRSPPTAEGTGDEEPISVQSSASPSPLHSSPHDDDVGNSDGDTADDDERMSDDDNNNNNNNSSRAAVLGSTLLHFGGGLFLRRNGSYNTNVLVDGRHVSLFGHSADRPIHDSACSVPRRVFTATAPPKVAVHPPFVSFYDLRDYLYPSHIFDGEEDGCKQQQQQQQTKTTAFRLPSHCTGSLVWHHQHEKNELFGAFSTLNGDVVITRTLQRENDHDYENLSAPLLHIDGRHRSNAMLAVAAVAGISALCVWSSYEESCRPSSSSSSCSSFQQNRPMWVVGRGGGSGGRDTTAATTSPWWEGAHSIVATTTQAFVETLASAQEAPPQDKKSHNSISVPRRSFAELFTGAASASSAQPNSKTIQATTILPHRQSQAQNIKENRCWPTRDPALRYAITCVEPHTALAYFPDAFCTTSPRSGCPVASHAAFALRLLDARCDLSSSSFLELSATMEYTKRHTPLLSVLKNDPHYVLFTGSLPLQQQQDGVGLVDLRRPSELLEFVAFPSGSGPISHLAPVYSGRGKSADGGFLFATAQGAQVAIWSIDSSKGRNTLSGSSGSSSSNLHEPLLVYSGHSAEITVMEIAQHCHFGESIIDRRQQQPDRPNRRGGGGGSDGCETETSGKIQGKLEFFDGGARVTMLTAALDNTLHLWQTTPLF